MYESALIIGSAYLLIRLRRPPQQQADSLDLISDYASVMRDKFAV
jgi:hypothetical protein